MAVFIDALAAQNIRPRIFVSKYKYFDTKYRYLLSKYEYFDTKYRYLLSKYKYLLSKYQYFLSKYDPEMIAENHHKHEKYKKIELITVLFYQSSHDKLHYAFVFSGKSNWMYGWLDSIAASLFENNWLS